MTVSQSIGNQQPGSPWCGTFRRAPPSSLATWHTEWSTNCLVPFDPGIHEFSELVINSRVGELKACSGWSQLMARFLLAYISFMGSQVDKVTEVKCGWWQWQLRLHHGVHEVDTLELRSPVLLEGSGVREVGQLRLLRSIVRWVVDATSWDDGTYCNVSIDGRPRWETANSLQWAMTRIGSCLGHPACPEFLQPSDSQQHTPHCSKAWQDNIRETQKPSKTAIHSQPDKQTKWTLRAWDKQRDIENATNKNMSDITGLLKSGWGLSFQIIQGQPFNAVKMHFRY